MTLWEVFKLCGKLFSHGKLFNHVEGILFVWPNIFNTGMHKSTMKTCDHMSSRDLKKQAGSDFVMRAGLRSNEFSLCGLTQPMLLYSSSTYE